MGDGPNKHLGSPSTQLLTPFAGSDDGWKQRSIRSSVDRMMGNVEDDDTSNEYDLDTDYSDFDDENSFDDEDSTADADVDTAETDDEADNTWDDKKNNSFDFAPITKDEDPLIAAVLPDSVKKVEKRTEARMKRTNPTQPSTHMEDNPLISSQLKAQVKKEMGMPTTEKNRDIERDVTNVLVHERSHALQLEKELAKARAETAEAKKQEVEKQKQASRHKGC